MILNSRGMDPKLKKVTSITHAKKHTMDVNGHVTSDRSLHQEQRTNVADHSRALIDDSSYAERFKKKNMKQDSREHLHHKDIRNEVELPPVSGLTLPSVKGAEGRLLWLFCNENKIAGP